MTKSNDEAHRAARTARRKRYARIDKLISRTDDELRKTEDKLYNGSSKYHDKVIDDIDRSRLKTNIAGTAIGAGAGGALGIALAKRKGKSKLKYGLIGGVAGVSVGGVVAGYMNRNKKYDYKKTAEEYGKLHKKEFDRIAVLEKRRKKLSNMD